jgi:hypothetical protein
MHSKNDDDDDDDDLYLSRETTQIAVYEDGRDRGRTSTCRRQVALINRLHIMYS